MARASFYTGIAALWGFKSMFLRLLQRYAQEIPHRTCSQHDFQVMLLAWLLAILAAASSTAWYETYCVFQGFWRLFITLITLHYLHCRLLYSSDSKSIDVWLSLIAQPCRKCANSKFGRYQRQENTDSVQSEHGAIQHAHLAQPSELAGEPDMT